MIKVSNPLIKINNIKLDPHLDHNKINIINLTKEKQVIRRDINKLLIPLQIMSLNKQMSKLAVRLF